MHAEKITFYNVRSVLVFMLALYLMDDKVCYLLVLITAVPICMYVCMYCMYQLAY